MCSAIAEPVETVLATPFGRTLPCAGFTIDASPAPRWPIVHRNIRGVHGLMTSLVGPHQDRVPNFALVPSPRGIGWAALLTDGELARRLAGKSYRKHLFNQPCTVTLGVAQSPLNPRVLTGRTYRAVITAHTPVSIRNTARKQAGKPVYYDLPTQANLTSTLCDWVPQRLGLEATREGVELRVLAAECKTRTVPLGGKFGRVAGFTGRIAVEVNPQGLWLLKCAEVVGLGSRTAYGFGRVSVEVVSSRVGC